MNKFFYFTLTMFTLSTGSGSASTCQELLPEIEYNGWKIINLNKQDPQTIQSCYFSLEETDKKEARSLLPSCCLKALEKGKDAIEAKLSNYEEYNLLISPKGKLGGFFRTHKDKSITQKFEPYLNVPSALCHSMETKYDLPCQEKICVDGYCH